MKLIMNGYEYALIPVAAGSYIVFQNEPFPGLETRPLPPQYNDKEKGFMYRAFLIEGNSFGVQSVKTAEP